MSRIALVRRPVYAVLVGLAALAAGCGSGSKAGSTWEGPTGASIAPASAPGFVSVNTDQSSSQWKNADALLKKFPIRDKLLASIEKVLSDNGVDFNTDILPLLGPELDLVVLDGGRSSPELVGMTKPTDALAFNGYLDAASPPAPHMEVEGWTIFARSQAALDAFTTEREKGTLADDASFKEATGNLPSDTNGIGYLNGTQAAALVQNVPQLGALPAGQLQWLAVTLSSQSDSAKLGGVVKTTQSVGAPFKATLLSEVPLGALVAVSFHGSAQLRRQLTHSPAVARAAGPLKKFLGVGVTDLTALVEGEGALYVSAGIPYPEVTLVLKEQDPAAAMATLNKVAAKVASTFKGKLTDYVGAPGIKKLHLGGIAIYYGIARGNLMISDASGHLLASVGTPLADDPTFTKVKNAAGLPDRSAGFVYVNLKSAIPALKDLAQTLGSPIPPDVAQNLAPLESFIAYATGDGSVTKFSALLQVR